MVCMCVIQDYNIHTITEVCDVNHLCTNIKHTHTHTHTMCVHLCKVPVSHERVDARCRSLTPWMLSVDERKWSSDRLWLLWLEIWHERDPSTPSQQTPARRQENKRDRYLPRPALCFPILGLYIMKSNGFGLWGLLYSYKCSIIITVSAKITCKESVTPAIVIISSCRHQKSNPKPHRKIWKFIYTKFWVVFF